MSKGETHSQVLTKERQDALPCVLGLRCRIGHSGDSLDHPQGSSSVPVIHKGMSDIGVFLDVSHYAALGEHRFEFGSRACEYSVLGTVASHSRASLRQRGKVLGPVCVGWGGSVENPLRGEH